MSNSSPRFYDHRLPSNNNQRRYSDSPTLSRHSRSHSDEKLQTSRSLSVQAYESTGSTVLSPCVIVAMVIFVVSFVAVGVVLAVIFGGVHSPSTSTSSISPTTGVTNYGANIKFTNSWDSNLSNNSSEAFASMQSLTCAQLEQVFQTFLATYYTPGSCSVISFTQGSVIGVFRFNFNFAAGSSNIDNTFLIRAAIVDGSNSELSNSIDRTSVSVNAQWDVATVNPCEQSTKVCQQYCSPANAKSKTSSYTCYCDDGYALSSDGKTCVAQDVCASNPCANFGKCIGNAKNTAFTCICAPSFTGTTCNNVQSSSTTTSNPANSCSTTTTTSVPTTAVAMPTPVTGVTSYGTIIGFNMTYVSDLSSPSSAAFMSTQTTVCVQMSAIFQSYLTAYYVPNSCLVTSFTAGSVVAAMRFLFNFPAGSNNVDNSFMIRAAILEGAPSTAIVSSSVMVVTQWDSTALNVCELKKPCDQFCAPSNAQSTSSTFSCYCAEDYDLDSDGKTCIAHDICASNPCANFGKCVANFDNTAFTCLCPPSYTGNICTSLLNNCQSTSCMNGGTCTSTTSGFSCACNSNFTGQHCELNVTACSSSMLNNTTTSTTQCGSTSCMNGGNCSQIVTGYMCTCPTGFAGLQCEVACQPGCSQCTTAGAGNCDDFQYCNRTQYFTFNVATHQCSSCQPGCSQCNTFSPNQCDDVQFCSTTGTPPMYNSYDPTAHMCSICQTGCSNCTVSGFGKCDGLVYCNTTLYASYDTTTSLCNPCQSGCSQCTSFGVGTCDDDTHCTLPSMYGYNSTSHMCTGCQSWCTMCTANGVNKCDGKQYCKNPLSLGYDTTNKVCGACANNCLSCHNNGASSCDPGMCAPGYVLYTLSTPYSCMGCSPHCSYCVTSGMGSCDPGYCTTGYTYVAGPPATCAPCTPHCDVCDVSGQSKCDVNKCSVGYTYIAGANPTCAACASGCDLCTVNGQNSCDVGHCSKGYVYVGTTTFQRCGACIANCDVCNYNGEQFCDPGGCASGYVYNPYTNLCDQCQDGCSSCNNNMAGRCDGPAFCSNVAYGYDEINLVCLFHEN